MMKRNLKILFRIVINFLVAGVITLVMSVKNPDIKSSYLYFSLWWGMNLITCLMLDTLLINKNLTDKQKTIIGTVLAVVVALCLISGLMIYSHIHGYDAMREYVKASLEPLT